MKSKKNLQEDITQLDNLHGMVTVFQEVSATNIKLTRDDILHQREFVDGLNHIHKIIKITEKKEDDKDFKEAAVFISANAHLNGSIVYESFKLFNEYVKQNTNLHRLIFGKLGEQLSKQANLDNVSFFELSDSTINFKDLTPAINILLDYDTIHMFHGRFYSLGRQEPTHIPLMSIDQSDEKLIEEAKHYLFEPSQKDLEQVFKHELLILLLAQTIKEANLAKEGSRFKQLDSATQKIGEEAKKAKYTLLRFLKEEESKKQITRVSRIKAFKKR